MGGIAEWLTFKTAKQREKERKMYARWAFPYGDDQREKLMELIRDVLPQEDPKTAMAIFLIGREAYRGSFQDEPEDLEGRTEKERRAALEQMLATQLFGRYKKMLPYYEALVLADDKVDENLNYPSAEEIRRVAENLK